MEVWWEERRGKVKECAETTDERVFVANGIASWCPSGGRNGDVCPSFL